MAMFAFGFQNVNAQDGIKIVTNHPDLTIKVKRCTANGKTVVLDLIFTNTSGNDADMRICMGNGETKIHDDEGNEYNGDYEGPVSVKIANKRSAQWVEDFTLISDVPTKVQWTITGVPNSVEEIARVQFKIICNAWSLDNYVTIRNIPITRQ